MMKEIDSSEDPGKRLGQAMQIPLFTEFVDECLSIVEPQDENKMEYWLLLRGRNKQDKQIWQRQCH